MNVRRLVAASLISFSMMDQSLAADSILYRPLLFIPVFSWAGGFIGGHIGYVHHKYHAKEKDSLKDFGLLGLYTGYNFDFGQAIAGFDISASYLLGGDKLKFGEGNLSLQNQFSAGVRARLGYAMNQFLPYVAGGFSYLHTDLELDAAKMRHDWVGYNIGLGIDYAVTQHLLATFEYRYMKLKKYRDADKALNVDGNEIRLGVAYKY